MTLLGAGVELDKEDAAGQTALHWAARDNAYEVVEHLVRAGAWVDAYDSNDDTALHIAIRCAVTSGDLMFRQQSSVEVTSKRLRFC